MTREEAIEILEELWGGDYRCSLDSLEDEAVEMAIEALKQPERKKGKWKVDWDWGIATCTNCNHDYDDGDNGYINEMRYCSFCGAKMEGEE